MLVLLKHPFLPVYNKHSRVLILGTFPSVQSRQNLFYYGHPQNRFWKIISAITQTHPVPQSIADKTKMLLQNKIALFDVIQSCSVTQSKDSSIHNVTTTDLSEIFQIAPIQQIFANGSKAYQLYNKYCAPQTHRNILLLPSSSSANASYNIEKLINNWEQITKYID